MSSRPGASSRGANPEHLDYTRALPEVAVKSGLVSVSFRRLDAAEVVDVARRAGLEGIEWGGDVHAPHGNVTAAHRVAGLTRDAGLAVAAFGSYYRLGGAPGNPDFGDVLASAKAMGAPLIRVWAGTEGGLVCGEEGFLRVAKDAGRVAELAWSEGLRVGLEYHADTLTDSSESTRRLLDAVPHPGLCCFWQAPVGADKGRCLEGLEALVRAGRLGSLHVFHWWPDAGTRLPLEAGGDRWSDYLKVAAGAPGGRYCCLEFVRGDDPKQVLADAAALKRWLRESG